MKKPMPVPRSGSVGLVPLLFVFCLAYVMGLMSSATFQHLYIHNILSPLLLPANCSQSPQPSLLAEALPCILPPSPPSVPTPPPSVPTPPPSVPIPPPSPPPPTPSTTHLEGRHMAFTDFLAPSAGVMHNMTDEELFWRASMAPRMKSLPKHVIVPKIAFMFLVRGDLPLHALWDRFFNGHEGMYSIYVHARPGYTGSPPPDSPFYGRMIPSQRTKWGDMNLVDAERRLLGNALLDLSNAHFALLSESCIPLHDFPTIHAYITGSNTSFVESFDRPEGRSRHTPFFAEHNISLEQWRKGAQWFVMDRVIAVEVVSDETYYDPVFRGSQRGYMDEHYMPTLVNVLGLGNRNSNRSVMYSDWWTPRVRHPKSHNGREVTEALINEMRRGMDGNCTYNGGVAEFCALFARKFQPDALEALLDLAPKVMGFG